MHTIHKTEVLTVLRSIITRLESNHSESDWSRDICAACEGKHGELRYRFLFWKHSDEYPGDQTVGDLLKRVGDQAKRITELEAETHRWRQAEVDTKIRTEEEMRRLVREREDMRTEVDRLNRLLSPPLEPEPDAPPAEPKSKIPPWFAEAMLHAQIADSLGVTIEDVCAGVASDDLKTITIKGQSYTMKDIVDRLEKHGTPLVREERCTMCGVMTTDWVDPDWAGGRVCRKCDSETSGRV